MFGKRQPPLIEQTALEEYWANKRDPDFEQPSHIQIQDRTEPDALNRPGLQTPSAEAYTTIDEKVTPITRAIGKRASEQ